MSFVLVLLLALHGSALGQTLSSSFYDSSCPNLTTIVRAAVQQAVQAEARIAASFVRLHFHDCFVNGCDASILLDGANLEQNARPNAGSARGFDIVDSIKSSVESSCPGVVSCADLLALIARDSVVALNGPSWTVVFGRRDSLTASQSAANANLPPPTLNASALITSFQNQGLSTTDMVALSGAHTIGQAQCTTFKARLYGPFQRAMATPISRRSTSRRPPALTIGTLGTCRTGEGCSSRTRRSFPGTRPARGISSTHTLRARALSSRTLAMQW
ncbi:peroxidase 52 isoform X2 [Selaginella moellendorffii]|uniref:peroxidase 52 isoform X2 n=1 Tax=Selaginella moellendorffii TaxID=88036 RepID=UPI000D1CB209|nr:peroxidase 52 isoform X2 [Selaginella moellendorffii]|eukprot:XP_024535018.1 peroxidase 52 isoform X2 [Selaginella moellendorffii]